ncbi:type VII secretion protein EccCa [Streptomyces sp. NPDC005125]
MSTVLFRRPARRSAPELPSGELSMQAPPPLPALESQGLMSVMGVLPMAAQGISMSVMFLVPGISSTIRYVTMGAMAFSMVLMLIMNLIKPGADRKRKLRGERRGYLRYLAQERRKVRKVSEQQRRHLLWQHPAPDGLWSLALSKRLWERRPNHPDFGETRIGIGPQGLAVQLKAPESAPVEDLEPVATHALRRFMEAYTTVPHTPISIYLPGFAHILMDGDRDVARALTRSMLAGLATLHSPEDLRIAVLAGNGTAAEEWEWAKWLPHSQHAKQTDGAGPVRVIAEEWEKLEELIGSAELGERGRYEADSEVSANEPYLVIIVDSAKVPANAQAATSGYRNAVVIDLSGALPRRTNKFVLRLQVSEGKVEQITRNEVGADEYSLVCEPDALSVGRCSKLARLIAPHRAGGAVEKSEPTLADFELPTLLGVGDAKRLDPQLTWRPRSTWDQLRIPIGISESGVPVELDIKEAARGGMGPHGILIGATGSGKSELLRTLVLGLAVTHSSEALNFVLVDFKGGATFLGMERLPHTSAVITNLADELPLVDRMQEALQSEMTRRQELLRAAGNYSSVHDYEKARAAGADLAPLPSLFVVVDEFSELLSQKREFIETFVMIGRLGRSLAVHLLLASQRLEEGRIHALQSHLSYRIGLRTFSVNESRAVLGVPDAYTLPSAPGHGYLKTDTSTLERFRAAYVSGVYRSATNRARRQAIIEQQVVPFTTQYIAPRVLENAEAQDAVEEVDDAMAETMMDIILDKLENQGPPAHLVWLPPLGAPPTLDMLLPPLSIHPELGLCTTGWDHRGTLKVPVGTVDKPLEQRRDNLWADLSGAGGHVGIVGGTQSGKSTMVRSLVTGLALTHTPREVQFYCLDFGGGSLSSLRGLPHVGSMAGRLDVDRVVRSINEIKALIDRRENFFPANGIESMAEYRKARQKGQFTEDPFGDVFLVIDGWFTLRQDFEKMEPAIQEIASRGLAYGVHLIIASNRWADCRAWLRDAMGTRFELRLGEPMESDINSKAAAGVPKVAGRGLTRDRLHFMAAVPRTDSVESSEELADAHRDLVSRIAECWTGPVAPQVKLLPEVMEFQDLAAPEGDVRIALGLEERALAPAWHDFEQHPHLIAFGETETGKTNLLKTIGKTLVERYTPEEARFIIADPRRNLFDAIPKEYQLSYAVAAASLENTIKDVAQSLTKRIPGPEISPDRLPLRDWWSGPKLFMLIDDYDLLISGNPMRHPFAPVLDLMSQGTEIGFHVVVARSTTGAMRSMSDQLIKRVLEVGTPALLFSCGREDGAFLHNTPPKKLPAGRAQLITRRSAPVLIQTAMADKPE